MDDELRQLLETLRQENAVAHAETRGYVDRSIERSAAETREYVDRSVERSAAETREYVDWSIERSAGETRMHFESIAERLESKIELVAEGVLHVDQKLDREAADIRQEMRQGFAETQGMIRFSHAELDQRVRNLEGR